ncbi:hypothetical protein EHS13_34965 [Paenibacillus psychroresistens]|uniref:Uncharacterized protein n=1 Tax=Paenibacillus psychroresistens TaxID=1778678 RepID=A0A6B8RX03_9BACL|nr:hypothetical protein [Paenibacillus psychroresistens]QGQ99696.1 hypothetical protein EHS13_34965 [Paenibacillus psychroresistens]
MKKTVKQMLEALNEKFAVIGSLDAGQMVILERGSRVIELKAPNHDESAFWTNLSAIAEEQWNVGGDRTWISPELDYFIDASGEYDIPKQLDPGSYWMGDASDSDKTTTQQAFMVRNSRTNQNIHLKMHKQYSPIPNPMKRNFSTESSELLDISYVGYECETRLLALPEERSISRLEGCFDGSFTGLLFCGENSCNCKNSGAYAWYYIISAFFGVTIIVLKGGKVSGVSHQAVNRL